jgi:hypothetical protein
MQGCGAAASLHTAKAMKQGLQTLCLALAIAFVPAPALTLEFPDPLSQDELLQKSDLVALVRVLGVTCIATGTDQDGKVVPVRFNAALKLLELRKGKGTPGDVVFVDWSNVPGDVTGAYFPGEELWTHLTIEDGGYRNTWWNAKGPTMKEPTITALPTTVGETLSAD